MDEGSFAWEPFPRCGLLEATLGSLARLAPEGHLGARDFVGVPEEPVNTRVLSYIRPHLPELVGDRSGPFVTRAGGAGPATGFSKAHGLEQTTPVLLALKRPQ